MGEGEKMVEAAEPSVSNRLEDLLAAGEVEAALLLEQPNDYTERELDLIRRAWAAGIKTGKEIAGRALDTGGPQGPPPTSTPAESKGSEGGGAGLNLDRLAHRSTVIASGDTLYTTRTETVLAHDVLALVERVRTLEAVAEAARRHESVRASFRVGTGANWPDVDLAQRQFAAALAAAGGPDGQ